LAPSLKANLKRKDRMYWRDLPVHSYTHTQGKKNINLMRNCYKFHLKIKEPFTFHYRQPFIMIWLTNAHFMFLLADWLRH